MARVVRRPYERDLIGLRIRIETHERYTVGDGDFNAALLEHIRPAAGLQLLDVGCGPGLQHALLQAHQVRVTGVDLSYGMLREAAAANRDACYAQANAVTLPFGNAQFDRVLCNGVLYHVHDGTSTGGRESPCAPVA